MVNLVGELVLPFPARYQANASRSRSIGCVGLDYEADHIPPVFGDVGKLSTWLDYNAKVTEAAAQYFPIVKPQSAFYEAVMMIGGMDMLYSVVEKAKSLGLMICLDAKREDIGTTMQRYGEWILGVFGFDAVTINSYLGPTFKSTWLEFLAQGRLAFRMAMTSNPEGAELQKQHLWRENAPDHKGPMVYEWSVVRSEELNAEIMGLTNGQGSVGAVVGANLPEEAIRCRELAPNTFFLMPGMGAQGGTASDAVAGLPLDGRLLCMVNNSRGITKAWVGKDGDPMEHVVAAMQKMHQDLYDATLLKLGFDPFQQVA